MYIYEGHAGTIFVTKRELTTEEEYCEICDDYDMLLGEADTREEAWTVIQDLVDWDGMGGWSEDYAEQVINTYFKE